MSDMTVGYGVGLLVVGLVQLTSGLVPWWGLLAAGVLFVIWGTYL